MKMIEDKGLSKRFKGDCGEAVITRNFGNADKRDYWSAVAMVDGKFKTLARRATYEKALALIEKEIG